MARILVIEEDLELRVALTRFLAALGHDVVAFDSHDEVMNIGCELGIPTQIDLAILDVAAADPQALRDIAALKDAFPHLAVVVTAKPEALAALYGPSLLARALGAAAALLKPFTAAQLQATIERILAPRGPGDAVSCHSDC